MGVKIVFLPQRNADERRGKIDSKRTVE